jgi:hypothetical protein
MVRFQRRLQWSVEVEVEVLVLMLETTGSQTLSGVTMRQWQCGREAQEGEA